MENNFDDNNLKDDNIMITAFKSHQSLTDELIFEDEPLFQKYDFAWDLMDVIIGGKSSIDLIRLNIQSIDEANVFFTTYGYDLDDSNVKQEMKHIFDEAIEFLENVLMPDPFTKEEYLAIPDEIKNYEDIRKTMLIASNMDHELQAWACAVLRVMHTISHVNNDISLKFFPEIQRQILDKIWGSVYINDKGEKFFGDEKSGVKIYDIDIKAKKERKSTILKLLHKIENVAADVFDQIGVRVITYDKVDALLVIKHLKKSGILNFCNVKPSRSINRLIDTKLFKRILNHYKEQVKNGEITKAEFEQLVRKEAENEANIASASSLINPHSNKDYKSIQFTCRQMIRMSYPLDDSCQSTMKESFCFFFPYEMQVVDIETHLENRFGKGSYEKYKEKQLITARQRVLGRLIRNQLNSNLDK